METGTRRQIIECDNKANEAIAKEALLLTGGMHLNFDFKSTYGSDCNEAALNSLMGEIGDGFMAKCKQ